MAGSNLCCTLELQCGCAMTVASLTADWNSVTEDMLSVLRGVAPELQEVIERRFAVLQAAAGAEPVGRRSLAERLGWPERTVRSEVEVLKRLGLIQSRTAGVTITPSGSQMLNSLRAIMRELHGLAELEGVLAAGLGLHQVVVVPGDSESDSTAKDAMVRAAADYLTATFADGDVVAVSGGSTLADVAAKLPHSDEFGGVTFVPTGGGLGDRLEIEANAVAAQFARSLGAKYRLLHMRDDLEKTEVEALLRTHPSVAEMFGLIRSARIVVQGIGTLNSVAQRRGFSAEFQQDLAKRGVVGESLGEFFDASGKLVESTRNVGLRVDDLKHVQRVIAVAGGASRAEAILAVMSTRQQHVLITDEAAAVAVASSL